MDFYSYYTERLSWRANPYTSMEKCKDIAFNLLNDQKIPFRISSESAVCLLSALHDWAGEGVPVAATYAAVLQELVTACLAVKDEVELIDEIWCHDLYSETHPDDEPQDDPGEYCIGDPTEDEAGSPAGDGESEKGEDLYTIMKDFYDRCDETETKGVRRPYPDWEHWAQWTDDDWIKFEIYKKKILAAASYDFFTMSAATDALAAAKAHINILPIARQVEVALWCSDLVDELYANMENNLQQICAGSLYTPAGRAVHKQLCSADSD